MKILIMKVDGKSEIRDIGDDDTLHAVQWAIGGYAQPIPGWTALKVNGKIEKGIAFCDEEGKIKGRGINVKATKIWYHKLKTRGQSTTDFLVGDVVFLFGKEKS